MSEMNISLNMASPLLFVPRPVAACHPHLALDTSTVPKSNFILFGEQWINIQSFATQALALPINTTQWDATYGAFSQQAKVTEVLGAFKSLQEMAAQFGDPKTMKSNILSNPNYLTQSTPPSELYGHIIWLANNIGLTAGGFSNTYANLKAVLDPEIIPKKEDRAAALKEILTGKGGLQSQARSMAELTKALITKLGTFDNNYSAVAEKLNYYITGQDSIVAEANRLVSELTDTINALKKQVDSAYNTWLALTISACVASVGILVLSFGLFWPVAVAAGAGLGIAAAIARSSYNKLVTDLNAQKEDKRKKAQLVTDLSDLGTVLNSVKTDIGGFSNSLSKIQGTWLQMDMTLAHIVANYGVDQLSDLSWVMQAMSILAAQNEWQSVADSAREFTQNSLVTYNNSVSFGQPIPEDLAA